MEKKRSLPSDGGGKEGKGQPFIANQQQHLLVLHREKGGKKGGKKRERRRSTTHSFRKGKREEVDNRWLLLLK